MVVQSLDGERVVAGLETVELQFANSLSAQHVCLPSLRSERFLEREHLGRGSVNAHAEPYVALVVGLCWYESYVEHSVAVLLGSETIRQFAVLGQCHSVHAVSEHLHGLCTGRGTLVFTGVAGYCAVGFQRVGFAFRGFCHIPVNLFVGEKCGKRR